MAGSLGDWFKTPSRGERLRAGGVRDDLVQVAERTAFGRLGNAMLMALPQILTDDEVVLDLVEGRLDKQAGLLVLTTQRVVFSPGNHAKSLVVVPVRDVVSMAGRTHRGMSAVTITLRDDEVVVDQILGTQGEAFATYFLQAASGAPPAVLSRDPIQELAELRALHLAGTVSDAEFAIRKKQLFDQI